MRAVILDRDGVINRESKVFIKSPAEWQPIPGSLDAIAALCHAGYSPIVITNQSGLARGLLSEENLQAIHEQIRQELAARDAKLAAIYYCPHGPDDGCDCRKPRAGLFHRAATELKFSLAETHAIGDSLRDIQAARLAGAKAMLVRTGNGEKTEAELGPGWQVPVFDDLRTASAFLIAGNSGA